jgi:hypothetical protein
MNDTMSTDDGYEETSSKMPVVQAQDWNEILLNRVSSSKLAAIRIQDRNKILLNRFS